MGWVRISDDFYDHPAHAGNGLAAWGLWAWSLAWSNRNLRDGLIPWPVVERMDPDGKASGALLKSGRWIKRDDCVEVHDYLEYQPSAEQIREKRAKERERWLRRADSNGASTDTPPQLRAEPPPTPRVSQPQPQSLSNDRELGGAKAPTRTRGTRIPERFVVTDEMAEWAATNHPRVVIDYQTQKFVDHFKAKAGQDAVAVDWVRRWKNWIRTADEKGW